MPDEGYKRLILNNAAWIQEKLERNPKYFERLAKDQQPEFLWIGCSDSRVPAEDITGAEPGEIFVHRNVANLVVHSDVNLMSVVQYAVKVLKVKHVIVCGHYGCGGVRAAMTRQSFGLLNKWLRYIKDIYHTHQSELETHSDEDKRFNRMVELNILEQVHNLAKTSMVQEEWKSRGGPHLHGWVYGLQDGKIQELVTLKPDSLPDSIFQFDLAEG